ncbi:unnamed protein product, partial [Mesorhabditis spiculigera]
MAAHNLLATLLLLGLLGVTSGSLSYGQSSGRRMARHTSARKSLQPFLTASGKLAESITCLVNTIEENGRTVKLKKPIHTQCRRQASLNYDEWVPGCFHATVDGEELYECWTQQTVSMQADCRKDCRVADVKGLSAAYCCCWTDRCTDPGAREAATELEKLRYEVDA